jgi:hypothetical protein
LTVFLFLKRCATDPVGPAGERKRISSATYKSNNTEKAMLCALLSNFRAPGRKDHITDSGEIERRVQEWEAAQPAIQA